MNGLPRNETYDNPSRSPRGSAYQTQSLHRQSSRPLDNFGQPANGLYPIDDAPQRYDGQRFNDRMTSTLPPGYGAFDMGMSPAWNTSGFGQNNSFNAMAGGSRAKPSTRGRNPLPHVCYSYLRVFVPTDFVYGRCGLSNHSQCSLLTILPTLVVR